MKAKLLGAAGFTLIARNRRHVLSALLLCVALAMSAAPAHAILYTPLIMDGPAVGQNISDSNPGYIRFYITGNKAYLKIDAFDSGGQPLNISSIAWPSNPAQWPTDPEVYPADPAAWPNDPEVMPKDVMISGLGGVIEFSSGIWYITASLQLQTPKWIFKSFQPILPPCPSPPSVLDSGHIRWRRSARMVAQEAQGCDCRRGLIKPKT